MWHFDHFEPPLDSAAIDKWLILISVRGPGGYFNDGGFPKGIKTGTQVGIAFRKKKIKGC